MASTTDVAVRANGPAVIVQTPLPNPSLQVTADHRLKIVDTPVREPNADEVMVHVKATGICG